MGSCLSSTEIPKGFFILRKKLKFSEKNIAICNIYLAESKIQRKTSLTIISEESSRNHEWYIGEIQ
mgnify:CR=1 FL=1